MDYAQHIHACRETLGLTGQAKHRGEPSGVEKFAAMLGIKKKTVWQYENGFGKPSRSVLILLEKIMSEYSAKMHCQS